MDVAFHGAERLPGEAGDVVEGHLAVDVQQEDVALIFIQSGQGCAQPATLFFRDELGFGVWLFASRIVGLPMPSELSIGGGPRFRLLLEAYKAGDAEGVHAQTAAGRVEGTLARFTHQSNERLLYEVGSRMRWKLPGKVAQQSGAQVHAGLRPILFSH